MMRLQQERRRMAWEIGGRRFSSLHLGAKVAVVALSRMARQMLRVIALLD
jgi:hypothetical protein